MNLPVHIKSHGRKDLSLLLIENFSEISVHFLLFRFPGPNDPDIPNFFLLLLPLKEIFSYQFNIIDPYNKNDVRKYN